MSCEELDRWAGYFRYFYFYEDMDFEMFINLVKAGSVPVRSYVDWSKVNKFERGVQ